MEIDIRGDFTEAIDVIRFSSQGIIQDVQGTIYVTEGEALSANAVNISTSQEAKDLIKALEKAIELNWWGK